MRCFHSFAVLLALVPFMVGCESRSGRPVANSAGTQAATRGSDTMPDVVTHTDAEWKKLLTPEEYAVLREKATDPPFTNKYDNFFQPGTYSCAACGQVLFTSDTKFNSGCGWPAFYAVKAGAHVKLVHDTSYGMDRTEVLCARCGSHLGHVFNDAPQTPTGERFCINSTAIKFTPFVTAQPGEGNEQK